MAEDTEDQTVTRVFQCPLFHVTCKRLYRFKQSVPVRVLCVMRPMNSSYSVNIYRIILRLRLYLE